MTKLFSLLEFAAHLHAVERDMHEVGPKIIENAREMVSILLNAFRRAVMCRKQEIEAGSVSAPGGLS